MPPKRKATDAGSDSSSGSSPAKPSKAIKAAPAVAVAYPRVSTNPPVFPTIIYKNEKMPAKYSIPARKGTIKMATWNVTSIKSCCDPKHGTGLMQWLKAEDPDIVILTETKRNDMSSIPQDGALHAQFPYQEWANCSKKGYAGTAVLSKVKPISTFVNLTAIVSGQPSVITGRFACMEFESFYVIGTYVPNASEKLKNMEDKVRWQKAFELKIKELKALKPVIWGGDVNAVATGNDISEPQKAWNKLPGFTEIESGFFTRLQKENGMFDAWRHLKGDDLVQYSFHGKRVLQRKQGLGWRLDTFVLSDELKSRVVECEIRAELYGASDHVPVVLELSGALKGAETTTR